MLSVVTTAVLFGTNIDIHVMCIVERLSDVSIASNGVDIIVVIRWSLKRVANCHTICRDSVHVSCLSGYVSDD